MPTGCVTNQAYIYDKGGTTLLGPIPASSIQWERQRDAMTTARVVAASPSPECCALLAQIEPGRHELVIYRGPDRVWEGPVWITTDSSDRTFTIQAHDVLQYADWAIAKTGYNDTAPSCSSSVERAASLLVQELARFEDPSNPPINVVDHIVTYPSSALQCRHLLPYQSTVFEHIDDLASKSGLDYTVLGRAIHLFDNDSNAMGETVAVTEADFLGPIIVSRYGNELCTFAAATDGEGHYAWVQHPATYYGAVEKLITNRSEGETASTTVDRAGLKESAETLLRGRYPTPVTVRIPDSSSLNPAGVLNVADLVPGVSVPVIATMTCSNMSQVQRLDKVVVSEDGNGETIQLTLMPPPGELTDVLSGDDV